jgi:hypothetical protein
MPIDCNAARYASGENLPSTWKAGTSRIEASTSASDASNASFCVRWRMSSVRTASSVTRCCIAVRICSGTPASPMAACMRVNCSW